MDDQMQSQQPTTPVDGQSPMGDASAPVAMPTEVPAAPVADSAPAMPEAPVAPMGDASAPADDNTQNPTV